MSRQERIDLNTMLNDLPELRPLRKFVDDLQRLFAENQSEATAWRRHQRLTTNRDFLAVPELVKAMKKLGPEKFAKMIAFWGAQRVGGCGRTICGTDQSQARHEEKARYKWRSRRTIVRFMVLLLDRYWEREKATRSRWRTRRLQSSWRKNRPRLFRGLESPEKWAKAVGISEECLFICRRPDTGLKRWRSLR